MKTIYERLLDEFPDIKTSWEANAKTSDHHPVIYDILGAVWFEHYNPEDEYETLRPEISTHTFGGTLFIYVGTFYLDDPYDSYNEVSHALKIEEIEHPEYFINALFNTYIMYYAKNIKKL